MSSHASSLTSRLRGFIVASVLFLVAWQVAVVAAAPRRTILALALYGFVFHMVFGKAYALVPSYFDRSLCFPRVPTVHLPLATIGVLCLASAPLLSRPALHVLGALLWTVGVVLFLTTIGWTIRDNLRGRETGTGATKTDLVPVDRLANAFVPVALAYLAAGSYELLATATSLPTLLDGHPAQSTHLLAAGTAAILVFALGMRLMPRFLVVTPWRPLVALVLGTGAVGPLLIASGVGGHPLRLQAGAVVQTVALVGFAGAFGHLFVRSDRRRIGSYGVLAGAVFGVGGVLMGLHFAIGAIQGSLVDAHLRLNLLGFLGLTIMGVAYHFYPPAAGAFRGAGNRTALASIALVTAGLVLEVGGLLLAFDELIFAGRLGALVGVTLYAYLLLGLFWQRRTS